MIRNCLHKKEASIENEADQHYSYSFISWYR